MTQKLLQQGAEAKILLNERNNLIIKDRIKKSYRLRELDEKIRSQRARSEAKLLLKASSIIPCPAPFIQPSIKGSTKIKMPFIQGKKLSEHLDSFSLEKQKEICEQIGKSVAKLHNADIIHGDLTTSNMIFVEKEGKIFFIDFGLGFISKKIEDRAVDIHLLKQALEAKHFKHWQNLFNSFIKGYKENKDSKKVLERLKAVEKRGRYKH
jgi:TP53 regulating kinase-like protein